MLTLKHEKRGSTEEERKGGICRVIVKQSILLLRKNFILLWRGRKALILQVLVPFVFVGFLSLLQIALEMNQRNNEARSDVKTYPDGGTDILDLSRCSIAKGLDKCYTLKSTLYILVFYTSYLLYRYQPYCL